MKIYITLAFLLIPLVLFCQNLEVEGKAKITKMDKDNMADSVVVRLGDGTLGVRDVSSLSEFQILSISNDTVFLTNGGYVVLPDADTTNEKINTLIIMGDSLSISEGNTTMKVEVDSSNINEKISDLSIIGDSLAITEGALTMKLPIDSSNINELQEFRVSEMADTLFISQGNWVIIPGISDANPPPDGTPCDDNSVCTTNDQYISGVCTGTPIDCGDGIPCTIDDCHPVNGCINTPNDDYCQDGNGCNGIEICDPVLGCKPGIPVDCDDGNPCTTDICNPATGQCEHMAVADGTPCPGGTCSGGTCVSND